MYRVLPFGPCLSRVYKPRCSPHAGAWAGRGGARDHLVPLTAFALEQLKPLRELNNTSRSPFISDGKRTIVLETLSVAVRELSALLKRKHKIATFQLRDLRRTCETMLAEMGVSREIRAQVLSHGRASGVQAKHYDRYTYLPEKRVALEKWADRLKRILDPTTRAQLVRLPPRSQRR